MDIVNLANAYKLDKNEKECSKVLDSEDWTIVSDTFAISVAAVRGDVDEVIRFMRRLGQGSEWDGRNLEEWAAFFHIRDNVKFRKEFELVFKRPFMPAPKTRYKIMDSMISETHKNTKTLESIDKPVNSIEINGENVLGAGSLPKALAPTAAQPKKPKPRKTTRKTTKDPLQ